MLWGARVIAGERENRLLAGDRDNRLRAYGIERHQVTSLAGKRDNMLRPLGDREITGYDPHYGRERDVM